MFAKIEAKIAKHQFLSRSEYQALAQMLAKIRTALTRIDCPTLRAVESRYSKLMSRAGTSCRRFSNSLALKTELIVTNQFCYDSFGFGYFKFQN